MPAHKIPLSERFGAKYVVDEVTGCWNWTAKTTYRGYGAIRDERGRTVGAHRVAYRLFVGEIPAELVIDHLCRNTRCVNPEHLEPVTIAENHWRGAYGSLKRTCVNGHPYTPENVRRKANGKRYCYVCHLRRQRRRAA